MKTKLNLNLNLTPRKSCKKCGMRKIVVDGVTYFYNIGQSYVRIRSLILNDVVPVNEISDRDVERGRHKKTSDGMIKPVMIANYIKSKIAMIKNNFKCHIDNKLKK